MVGAGQAASLPVGQHGVLKAPNLTVCAAALLRARREGKVVGYVMGHRQPIDFAFESAFQAEIKKFGTSVVWELVAVQHAAAPEVADGDSYVSSVDAIAMDLQSILKIPISETMRLAQVGAKESFGVRMMTVDVEEDGSAAVHQGESSFCVLL